MRKKTLIALGLMLISGGYFASQNHQLGRLKPTRKLITKKII